MTQDEIMSNTETGPEKRGRGRPLKYPRGEEPHRSGGSHRPGREALRKRGGKYVTIRLEPTEVDALAWYREYRRHATDRDAIGSAIFDAANAAKIMDRRDR